MFLKNLLLQNIWLDFEIISQNVPCVTLLKKCSQNIDPSINMALVNGGFLHYTDLKKFLEKSSSQNPLVRFEKKKKKITGMFLWWPFSKIVREILIRP